MAKLKVCVEAKLCTGEALCTGISPRYFELITDKNGDHKAEVRGRDGKLRVQDTLEVNEDDYDEVLEAGERCPPKAIFIWELDEDGEEEQLCP